MLRQEMSVSERVVWDALRGGRLGFKFRRQHPLEHYILDFYCAEALLNVETDGEQHDLTRSRDRERDAAIARHGILTVRVPNLELFERDGLKRDRWIREIVSLCEERSGRKAWALPSNDPEPSPPTPSPFSLREKGEGAS